MKILEKLLKRLLLLFIRRLFPRKIPTSNADDWRSFKRVLIFRLDSRLGNCVLVLPLIQSIKESLPAARIDVLMTGNFSQIYDNHPDIYRIIPYDQEYLLKRPWRYLGLLRQLRKVRYDVAFSSSNPNSFSVSQAIFARIISTGRSVGFKWHESERLYTDAVVGRTDIFYGDAQVDLWRYFDFKAKYKPPRLYFAGKPHSTANRDVLIWLGARGNKVLPEVMLNRIAHMLQGMGISYEYAAGPSDQELVISYSTGIFPNVEFLGGDLRNAVQFFRKFKLLIMPDTGPMHLAAALDIPLIQIFIDSNKTWYGYHGERQMILTEHENLHNSERFIKKHIRNRERMEQGKVIQ